MDRSERRRRRHLSGGSSCHIALAASNVTCIAPTAENDNPKAARKHRLDGMQRRPAGWNDPLVPDCIPQENIDTRNVGPRVAALGTPRDVIVGTLPPVWEQNIVTSGLLCVCVCLSASISSELGVQSSPAVSCVLSTGRPCCLQCFDAVGWASGL